MMNAASNPLLQAYIEPEILSQYDHFDKAHQRDRAETVMDHSTSSMLWFISWENLLKAAI